MKSFLSLTLALLLLNSAGLSQGSCSTANVSPQVAQPIQTGIVSSTCSTLVVKWQGSASQTYCVSGSYFNSATNKKDTAAATNIICDGSQSCTATIPVISCRCWCYHQQHKVKHIFWYAQVSAAMKNCL